MRRACLALFGSLVVCGLVLLPSMAAAYPTYTAPTNPPCTGAACNWDPGAATYCGECHPHNFDNFPIHNQHRRELITAASCNLCHSDSITGDRPGVYLNRSDGTAGDNNSKWSCVGCHGVDQGAVRNNPFLPASENGVPSMSGHGLRLHHENAVGAGTCNTGGCHAAVTPLPENTIPPFYTRANVDIKDPCNPNQTGAGSEDFRSLPNRVANMGLDNDGDMLYDTTPPAPYMADPDCAAAPQGACCLVIGGCRVTDSAGCPALTGSYQGDGTDCATDCGACCSAAAGCTNSQPSRCGPPDIFHTGTFCAAVPDPCTLTPVGACCMGDGKCSPLSSADCQIANGSYQGDGTTCNIACGACCSATGGCINTQTPRCNAPDVFNAGTFCAAVPDPCVAAPTGACCMDDGTCTEGPSTSCAPPGSYQGDGTTCANDCGACCAVTGDCINTPLTGCNAPDVFHGGTNCTAVPAPCVAGCVVANLQSIGNSFILVKSGTNDIQYNWTVPSDGSTEIHANYVATELELATAHRAPVGPALDACTITPPVATCTEVGGMSRVDTDAYYQAVSACGPAGGDEGPF